METEIKVNLPISIELEAHVLVHVHFQLRWMGLGHFELAKNIIKGM